MDKKEYKYSDITENIIGAAFSVHSYLGNGFQEIIYQRALVEEFHNRGIRFLREHEMPIFYYDVQIGTRRVDFLVEDKILVEIKATTALEEVHHAQILNYLTAYNLEVGLLINFGEKSLKFRRFVNRKNSHIENEKAS